MAAAAQKSESFWDEATCSICLEYFTDPVSIPCGHSFCRACIDRCWGESETNFSCPQCRDTAQQRSLRPCRELGSLVERVKELKLQVEKELEEGPGLCERHREPLKLFCEEDQAPICLVCDRAKEHRDHRVLPIEEAAQDYKNQIQDRMNSADAERERLQRWKRYTGSISQCHLEELETVRQKFVSEFEQMHQFLEEQECLLLVQLGEFQEELEKEQKENATKLSEEISHLGDLIREMEAKHQQPANIFLQDIKSTLSRSNREVFHQLPGISSQLEKRLGGFVHKLVLLQERLQKFRDTFPAELKEAEAAYLAVDAHGHIMAMVMKMTEASTPQKANVTLDPDTAHPNLIVFKDRKNVGFKWQNPRLPLAASPERFTSVSCVLGCEGFTVGRHYWEVEVGEMGDWAVGVARASVKRKGEIRFGPDWGIWAVQQCGGQYRALDSSEIPLSLSRRPRRIRVCLHYAERQVAFSDADTRTPIFLFPLASFSGERIRPWFWVGDMESPLRLSP